MFSVHMAIMAVLIVVVEVTLAAAMGLRLKQSEAGRAFPWQRMGRRLKETCRGSGFRSAGGGFERRHA